LDGAEARAEAALRRDGTLEAVAFAAQRLLQDPDWGSLVPHLLRRLGEAIGVSRAYLFENRLAGQEIRTTLRAQWLADESLRRMEPGAELGFRGLERWVTMLGRGDVVTGTPAEFPPSERGPLADHGIRSILLAPVPVAGGWWGYMGFDDCEDDRVWTQIEIDALRAAAGTLGAAIERERSDRRIREAEARYRDLVENIPAVTYRESLDANAELFYISPQIKDVFGFTPEEWTWTPGFWREHIHPEDRERIMQVNRETNETGQPFAVEYRFRRADGTYAWLQDQATLVGPVDGQRFWQGFMLDVTERREAEAAQAKAEARFRDLVENIPAVTYRQSSAPGFELIYVSPQAVQAFGYSEEEWTAEPNFWTDHIHPEDRDRVIALDRETTRSGEPFATEYRFRRSDGSHVWIHDRATLVGRESGELVWQGFMFDVTERKEAEAALAEAEARYRMLIEQVPAVMYTQAIDPEDPSVSNTVFIGPRTEEMLGYTVEETLATGGLWRDILHPDDRDRVLAADAEGNATGEAFEMEYRMIAKDGRIVWVHDKATVVRDTDGTPRFWQGFQLDITQRKLAEERLERALEVEREASRRLRSLDEMKNTFLQAVSHDLRTPLAAILGLAVTLERSEIDLPPEETRDLARRIATNARKLDRLVTDLLDLDRLARGIVAPKLHPVDLGALVARVAEDSDLMAQGRLRLDAPAVVMSVDAAKVERILENLLSNTLRHTPAGTPVWVSVVPEDGGVLLLVEDQGSGVPEEIRESIFEPFRQGPDAPEHSPGVGVGLTLVRRFAELHGGHAWVEGRDGGGASFRIFLPNGARA
jgi:PAS domain S-box-containing protein